MIAALASDYRQVTMSPTACEKPGWMCNAADKQCPSWVIQLTAGTDSEGSHYMLIRQMALSPATAPVAILTIHRYMCRQTYVAGVIASADPETVTLEEWLEQWREKYRQMTVVTLPPDVLSYGSVDPLFGALEAAPSSYCFEDVDVS